MKDAAIIFGFAAIVGIAPAIAVFSTQPVSGQTAVAGGRSGENPLFLPGAICRAPRPGDASAANRLASVPPEPEAARPSDVAIKE